MKVLGMKKADPGSRWGMKKSVLRGNGWRDGERTAVKDEGSSR